MDYRRMSHRSPIGSRVTRMVMLCALGGAASLPALPAAAQSMGPGQGIASGGFHPIEGVGQPQVQRDKVPAGVPGAASQGTPAPPEAIPSDIPPTEALFDAINRGDLPAAKDALTRGADLSGRNVLGMTPLDLSVDLSRNDITFLLLSLRNQFAVGGPPATLPPAGGKAQSAADARRAARQAKAAPQQAQVTATVTAHGPVNPQVTAIRYASVPAAPVPNAGFLGFGSPAAP